MNAQSEAIKNAELSKIWAALKTNRPATDPQGLPSKTWAAMSLRTRSVLVMLGSTSAADPRELARKPWAALTETDRHGIAACAREMGQDLKNSVCLF